MYYEFSLGDLAVSQRQLKPLIENYKSPPYEALLYLTGDCNYGGRVTDNTDRITLTSLLSDIYKDDIMYSHYRFCSLSPYKVPDCPVSFIDLINTIDSYPSEETPYLFGLHSNANIAYSREQGQNLLVSLIKIEAKSSASTINEKQELLKIFDEILKLLVPEFPLSQVKEKFPLQYKDSLNIFLQQEVQKYNTLTKIIKQSIGKLKKALEGQIIITHDLEVLSEHILHNQVPSMWASYSYLSSKPFMS